MQCRTHPEINGVNTCNQCGDWLCEDCTVEINGRIFCRRCLAQLAGAPAPEAPRVARTVSSTTPRHINGGLLFLFSFFMPPGVNYMYEGLLKRGLAALSGFFLLVFLTAQFSGAWPLNLVFGLMFPVLVLFSIFDGFHIRRRINAGETVNDDVDDILNFIRRNKHIIIGFVVLLLALSLVNTVYATLAGPLKRWIPLIVVGLGLYMLLKSPGRKSRRRGSRHEDDTRYRDDRNNME